MRIAFLNPWRNAAENQAFKSLEIAAARIGHELVHCINSDELEQTTPEFVLASASTQPKLTRFPTYGVIHEPRDRFLFRKAYFNNLLSYDGYLTISDTLQVFLKNLCYGTGRPAKLGYYYNTCQENSPDPHSLDRLKKGKITLTYFGTNWDKRRLRFFRLLSDLNDVEICGPQESWKDISRRSYGGVVPFDGRSVQDKYRENGIGLVLLSDRHLAEDIISNRIFEITSVGAIAICCRTPWIEKAFGDTVYYFDQQGTATQLIDQVSKILKQIKSEPLEAYTRAQQAQRIFVERFSAEKLIQNAIDYHQEMKRENRQQIQLDTSQDSRNPPLISVIVRCGGRPIEIIRRAICSIVNQTFGHFQVIIVRYKPLDLGPLLSEFEAHLHSIVCVDCFGGNRSNTLWSGLRHVKGKYFSILDDDDELTPEHFGWLFRCPEFRFGDNCFIYTGSIRVGIEPTQTPEGNLERRQLHTFGISECKSFFEQSSFFAPNSFVASSSLLSERLLADPELTTAEDSYLILSLLAKCEPRFNFRATAIQYESPENSNFARDPNRAIDGLNIQLRLLSHSGRALNWVDIHEPLRRQNETVIFPKIYAVEEQEDVIIYHCRDFPLSHVPRQLMRVVPFSFEAATMGFSEQSCLVDAKRGAMRISPPRAPWAYTAQFKLVPSESSGIPYLVEIDCTIVKGTLGFGVLNKKENDFVYRIAVPTSPRRAIVHLPIDSFSTVGRCVIHNWEAGGEAEARINTVTLLSE
jgi:hypothetical protein